MGDPTEADYRRAAEWLDNAKRKADVARAVLRLAGSMPGVEEWAVLLAVLRVWDGLDAGSKLDAIAEVASPHKGLVDGLLFRDEVDPDAPDDGVRSTLAPVRVGSRVVELREEGGTTFDCTVVQVLCECVIVERDPVYAEATQEPRVALRYNEFAIHPEPPPGQRGFPARKGGDDAQ